MFSQNSSNLTQHISELAENEGITVFKQVNNFKAMRLEIESVNSFVKLTHISKNLYSNLIFVILLSLAKIKSQSSLQEFLLRYF